MTSEPLHEIISVKIFDVLDFSNGGRWQTGVKKVLDRLVRYNEVPGN